ncbi:hypothetical protein GCM10020000_10180 [Streptomyces olivoverticillatus]
MYLADSRTTPDAPGTAGRAQRAGWRAAAVVPGTVLALGTVSLITDVSSEMVTAVLPLYLVTGLRLSPLGFGLLDGVYNGASALVRLVGGRLSDRRGGSHKAVATVGYGLSAVCKPLLLLVHSLPLIGAVLAADRTGKGLRTAPRDALISLASEPAQQGTGFRRAPCDGHGRSAARPARRLPDPAGRRRRLRRRLHRQRLCGGTGRPRPPAVRTRAPRRPPGAPMRPRAATRRTYEGCCAARRYAG